MTSHCHCLASFDVSNLYQLGYAAICWPGLWHRNVPLCHTVVSCISHLCLQCTCIICSDLAWHSWMWFQDHGLGLEVKNTVLVSVLLLNNLVMYVCDAPLGFSDIFPKQLGIFSSNFTYLLNVPIYAWVQIIISARQHAERAICYRPSVCPSVRPSVCHTGGSVKNGWTYHRNSFTIW